MAIRFLLLVVTLVAIGLGERADAARVDYQSSVVFRLDLPDIPSEYSYWASDGIGFSCTERPCTSAWDWLYIPPDDMDSEEIDSLRVSKPPGTIVAKFGTEPDLYNFGTYTECGECYFYDPYGGIFLGQMVEIPNSVKTLYVTFSLFDIYYIEKSFYDIDSVFLRFYWRPDLENWEYGADDFYDGLEVSGTLYQPIVQVPLPGSFLFILSSMAAASGLALRKGRASLS